MTPPPPPSPTRLILTHWSLLGGGALLGIAGAAVVSRLPFDFSSELEEARRLGIVSLTILNHYPKGRDLLLYALLILLPLLGALGPWLAWCRGRTPALGELLTEQPPASPPTSAPRPLMAWLLFLFGCLATFNLNRFYAPMSDWALLGETGEHLAWADWIINGGTYARDFFCLYGPLWIYPVAWTMKLFGASIVVFRAFGFGLDLLSYAILIAFLQHTIRHRALFIVAALTVFLIFPSLRFSLGLLPLLILSRAPGERGRLPLVPLLFSGVTLGASLLFSQEAGLCGVVATGVFLGLEARREGGYRGLARQGGLVAGGLILSLLPVLAHFYHQGALGRFFDNLYGYPKLVTLGYAALPFPQLSALLTAPFASGAFFPYWMIGVSLVAAITVSVQLRLGQKGRQIHLRAAVLVFGLLLFRAALGRSDTSHFINSSLPAILLTFLLVDATIPGIVTRLSPPLLRAGRLLLACALLLALGVVLGKVDRFRDHLHGVVAGLRHLPAKFTVQEGGVKLPQIPRAGIFLDPATAETLVRIKASLDRYTKERDYVLFFPNEAAYYFLFNRRSPTRYVLSYIAVTREQRLEMVAELEKNRPAYVVYTLDDWRIDGIPENLQVPEVVDYLRRNYSLAEELGPVVILRRNTP